MIPLLLGKNGDVINCLPAFHWQAQQTGERTKLIVDINYAPLLEGCSYIEPIVSPFQDFRDMHNAKNWAHAQGHRDIQIVQVSGHNWHPARRTSSYAADARLRCGVPDEAWAQPVVFDRRDATRETALIEKHTDGRPLVLLNANGKSSPFEDRSFLLDLVRTAAPDAQVLDLATVKAHRLFDLLGLYERAIGLVSSDTSTLHLAAATPKLPVVALISDRGGEWAGTLPLPTVRMMATTRYYRWRESAGLIAAAVRNFRLL